jgi:MOSC domain-containing protein YiiM
VNLEGDEQSDLPVHGGRQKAVYVYPSEQYAYWRNELPGVELSWGAFGENLTTAGVLEGDVYIGDGIRIGTAEFEVTQIAHRVWMTTRAVTSGTETVQFPSYVACEG